jgi:hypothetical protein
VQLLQLGLDLFQGLLGHVRGLDAFFQFVEFGALFDLAEFLLDRLDLFVQVVLALALFHLALDPATDALLDLEDVDFGFHEAHQMVQAALQVMHFENRLLLLQFQRQVRGDGVGHAPRIVNADQRGEDLRGDLLVEFDVVVELGDQGAAQGFDFGIGIAEFFERLGACRVMAVFVHEFKDPDALVAFHQHLDRAVRQLEHLQDAGDRADLVQIGELGLILGGRFLGDQQDVLAAFHGDFQGLDGLGPTDEQRNDHVREHHDVAQR